MNAFEHLEREARSAFADNANLTLRSDRPKARDGLYFLRVTREDGFIVEVEWHPHRGFGIVAGRDLVFGSGVDEVYGSAEVAFARIVQLVGTGDSTSNEEPVNLIDLRKLRGLLQKDVAESLGISKSGLAQMERPDALTAMQIDTLRKLVASLGGKLVLSAQFPEGHERRIAVD